jgi:protein-L-isoaspartate(D-aspartate) O-methyltransferase
MEREQELAIIRRAYAKQILAQVQVDNSRLEKAFADVHREDFLGPGPWVIPRWLGEYVRTPKRRPCLSVHRQRRAGHCGATSQ